MHRNTLKSSSGQVHPSAYIQLQQKTVRNAAMLSFLKSCQPPGYAKSNKHSEQTPTQPNNSPFCLPRFGFFHDALPLEELRTMLLHIRQVGLRPAVSSQSPMGYKCFQQLDLETANTSVRAVEVFRVAVVVVVVVVRSST